MPESIGDLHIHTEISPDVITKAHYDMKEALYIAAEKGVGVVAITEHKKFHDYDDAQKQAEEAGVILIPASELRGIISEGLRAKFIGHFVKFAGLPGPVTDILAYGVTEPIEDDKPIEHVVADIHRQNGLAILAHPSGSLGINWYGETGRKLIKELGIDGIEALNASIPQPFNRAAERLAKEHNLPVTGGSDARRRWQIGKGLTVFSPELTIATWEDCIRAIMDKKTSTRGTGIRLGPFFT